VRPHENAGKLLGQEFCQHQIEDNIGGDSFLKNHLFGNVRGDSGMGPWISSIGLVGEGTLSMGPGIRMGCTYGSQIWQ